MGRLERVREGWHESRRLMERIETLEALAEKVTPNITGMPKASSLYKDDVWARLIDARLECEASIKGYLEDYRTLETELNTIEKLNIREVLKYRYLNCLTVEKTAELMGIETRSVYRLLKQGKKIYRDMYEQET